MLHWHVVFSDVTVDDGAAGPFLNMMRGFTKILQPKEIDYGNL